MNVKPGDLAKVFQDPENMGIFGMQVVIIGPVKPQGLLDLLALLLAPGPVWDCQLLETRKYQCPGCFKLHLMHAGESYAIPDAWLKRIDPPEDFKELFRDAPIEGEKINQPKEKV